MLASGLKGWNLVSNSNSEAYYPLSPWTDSLSSLSFSFLICRVEAPSHRLLPALNKRIHVKHLLGSLSAEKVLSNY